jgi:hypothetical protein
MNPKLAVVLVAMLLAGSAGTAIAQDANSGGPPNGGTATTPRVPRSLGDTSDADVKAEYEEGIPYAPCPASVRFPNGRQMCLGMPAYHGGDPVGGEGDGAPD